MGRLAMAAAVIGVVLGLALVFGASAKSRITVGRMLNDSEAAAIFAGSGGCNEKCMVIGKCDAQGACLLPNSVCFKCDYSTVDIKGCRQDAGHTCNYTLILQGCGGMSVGRCNANLECIKLENNGLWCAQDWCTGT